MLSLNLLEYGGESGDRENHCNGWFVGAVDRSHFETKFSRFLSKVLPFGSNELASGTPRSVTENFN